MENLYNNFAKHTSSLAEFRTLLTAMYTAVVNEEIRMINKPEGSDDLPKFEACCNDLILIFDNAPLIKNYQSYIQRWNKNPFSGRPISEHQSTVDILDKLYRRSTPYKTNLKSHTKKLYDDPVNQLKNIIKESIEIKPTKE